MRTFPAITYVLDSLVQQRASVFIAATGGGAGLQDAVWKRPGISDVLIGAELPYHPRMLEAFLGFKPIKACDADTALHMAMAAYLRAWTPDRPNAIGLGLTAVVASLRPRHEHRCYVATFSAQGCWMAKLVLPVEVGAEARDFNGVVCDLLGLRMLAVALGLGHGTEVALLNDTGVETTEAEASASYLFWDRHVFTPDGKRHGTFITPGKYALLPTAANPPHEGHFRQAATFREMHGREVVFTIETNPLHKKALTTAECLQRASLLRGQTVAFTRNTPLYIDKARQHPNTPILLGADAALRLVDPQWGPVEQNLAEFKALGTTFHVTGRAINDIWTTFNDVRMKVPTFYWPMFIEAPGRWDISSTQLRATE